VKIPVVGMGGIAGFEDAMEFLLVGASAIQIGTMNFVYPDISRRIAEAMEAWFSAPGAPAYREYVGSLMV
jgi:dihydroorotate dehydrogenase (NAD+) catalytic subunit